MENSICYILIYIFLVHEPEHCFLSLSHFNFFWAVCFSFSSSFVCMALLDMSGLPRTFVSAKRKGCLLTARSALVVSVASCCTVTPVWRRSQGLLSTYLNRSLLQLRILTWAWRHTHSFWFLRASLSPPSLSCCSSLTVVDPVRLYLPA